MKGTPTDPCKDATRQEWESPTITDVSEDEVIGSIQGDVLAEATNSVSVAASIQYNG